MFGLRVAAEGMAVTVSGLLGFASEARFVFAVFVIVAACCAAFK